MSPEKPTVYLDHQASSPVSPEVLEAMRPYWSDRFGSPSSQHSQGLRARDALEEARHLAARMIGAASAEDVLFTSGATESANLALKGTALASREHGDHIILTAIEHPSVLNSALWLESQGFKCTRVGCDPRGVIDPADIRAAITNKTILVATHHANHDIGTIQAIEKISVITRERGIPLFCDGSSSGGWVPIDVRAMGVQLLSLAPHRFCGPKGVGILYRQRQARLESILHGGKQEGGKRSGTENVPGIVGAGVACRLAREFLEPRRRHVSGLQKKLIEGLVDHVPDCRLNGSEPGPGRSPSNVNLSIRGVEGESLLLLCDMQAIALGSGPSCVTQNLKKPHVLEAIGLNDADARGNIVMTLGFENTEPEIRYVLDKLPGLVEKLRSMSPSWK